MSNSYPLVLVVGVTLGVLWMVYFHRLAGPEGSFDLGLVALFAGLIGARIGHVAAYWSYYSSRLTEAAQFWQGGLSWAGAVLGGVIGVALYDALLKRPFWPDADRLAAPAVIVGAAAWFGCLLDACAYGQLTPQGPAMPDLLGVVAPRWPTQAVGGILTLISLAGIYRLSELALPAGVQAASALVALGAINFALAFARGDPAPVVSGLRLDGLASGALMTLGGIGWLARR